MFLSPKECELYWILIMWFTIVLFSLLQHCNLDLWVSHNRIEKVIVHVQTRQEVRQPEGMNPQINAIYKTLPGITL